MYYTKLISLLPLFFYLSSCEVTEGKKSKLLSDFINDPNVGHGASDGILRSVNEIDEHASGDDETQEDVKFQRNGETTTVNENKASEEQILPLELSRDSHNYRTKRHVSGGLEKQNPDDPVYRQLAEDSLRKYVSDSADKKPHTLLRVESVTTQIVAGSITRIDFLAVPNDNLLFVKKCHSEIFEQGWINKKEIKVSCEVDNYRSKRQIVGGWQKQNPNDPIYRQLAEQSLRKYVSESVDQKPHTLLQVEGVVTQVVVGLNTRIDFVAAPNDNLQYIKKCHSEIFEQGWINKKEIKVSCEVDNYRSKRQIVGGWQKQNPNDPIYGQLAEESLQKYVAESIDQKPHKLLQVEGVVTQVVAGVNTRIDFVAAPNDNLQYIKKCHSEIFEQGWINKKEIKVSCEVNDHRLKRQVLGKPGGWEEKNPNDPIYRQLAEESLRKYVSESVDQKPHTLLGVVRVTTQVVSGFVTRIDFVAAPNDNLPFVKKFHSEIWEQPWLNKKEIKVSCEVDDHRLKRQVLGKSGGLEEKNPNDPIYRQLAEESLRKYVSESVDHKPHTLLGVVRVTTQVVSGSLTRIDFVAAPNDDLPFVKKCHSEIWEQPWLNKKEIKVSCEVDDHRLKRQVLGKSGGLEEKNPNDPIYRQLAEESLRKYVSESVDHKPHTLLEVVRVTTQVVSGSLTRIDFVAAPNDDLPFVKKCHSEIWEQPWLNKKEIKVSCEVDDHRLKRQVLGKSGGLEEKNPNDPIYRQLAEESLRKYVSESVDHKPHTLLGVVRVTTQVVSGSMIRIDFVAVYNDNDWLRRKNCHSKIWEQPWLNKKEINVSCVIENIDRSKRHVPGELIKQDPNDPIYRQLAEESLQKYVSESIDKKPHTLLQVEGVVTQVVAGLNTRIDFLAAPNDNLHYVEKCHSEILEQPWLNNKEIKVSCEVDDHRLKRQVLGKPGGWEEKNPNDPIYRQLAEESLLKFVSESVDHKPHTLLGVVKVTAQVVAGLNTKIDFVAAPNDNLHYVKKCQSEIFEQGWINKKEIKVSCEVDNHRLKRQKPGGWIKQNPNDPIYIQLAEESLQKYVSESIDKKPHTLLQVEVVITQVVAGFNTIIDFVAAPNDSLHYVKKCHSEIFEPPSHPWVNKKEIKVSCEVDNHRLKRQGKPGGMEEKNPNDPIYRQLAEESLQKYVSESVDHKPHTLLGVVRVTTQVVSGSLTRIDFVAAPNDNLPFVKKCHSEIWEQPWLNKKEIEVSCEVDDHRLKRQVLGKSGGLEEKNPNDPIYRQLAEESLRKYVSESVDHKPHTLLGVVRVTTQVVSGSLTRIDFVAAPNDNLPFVKKCHSEIWEQPWRNKKEIKVSCEVDNHRFKRQVLGKSGELVEKNPNDPIYRQLAEESLRKYVSESVDHKPHTLLGVVRVTTQVVSGSLTRIDFVAAPNDNLPFVKKCHSEIWEQPWLNKREIKVSCEVDNHRFKRQVLGKPGGLEEKNPNDPIYRQLAEESLRKYVSESVDHKPHTLLGVVRVTTQVVSGSLTRIDFVAAPNDNLPFVKKCHSEIWEQPWLNKKEIKVSCAYDPAWRK